MGWQEERKRREQLAAMPEPPATVQALPPGWSWPDALADSRWAQLRDYSRERFVETRELYAWAVAVALALGGDGATGDGRTEGWRVNLDLGERVALCGPDGIEIGVQRAGPVGTQKGTQVALVAHQPAGVRHEDWTHVESICIGLARPPHQAARDVRTRLVAPWAAEVNRAGDRAAKHAAEIEANLDRLLWTVEVLQARPRGGNDLATPLGKWKYPRGAYAPGEFEPLVDASVAESLRSGDGPEGMTFWYGTQWDRTVKLSWRGARMDDRQMDVTLERCPLDLAERLLAVIGEYAQERRENDAATRESLAAMLHEEEMAQVEHARQLALGETAAAVVGEGD